MFISHAKFIDQLIKLPPTKTLDLVAVQPELDKDVAKIRNTNL